MHNLDIKAPACIYFPGPLLGSPHELAFWALLDSHGLSGALLGFAGLSNHVFDRRFSLPGFSNQVFDCRFPFTELSKHILSLPNFPNHIFYCRFSLQSFSNHISYCRFSLPGFSKHICYRRFSLPGFTNHTFVVDSRFQASQTTYCIVDSRFQASQTTYGIADSRFQASQPYILSQILVSRLLKPPKSMLKSKFKKQLAHIGVFWPYISIYYATSMRFIHYFSWGLNCSLYITSNMCHLLLSMVGTISQLFYNIRFVNLRLSSRGSFF